MNFEWDNAKNKKNLKKHGIDFRQAIRVFSDPNLLLVPDPCIDEERWDVIGYVDTVLFVVYTEMANDTLRIISARKATKEEINGYNKNDFRRS